ncbi:MAG TPA: hypothetical protein VHB50_23710, partial [Bryobacteraceae bacterium]|nr:hypothetical protein [Bryobacteraceae bacterium]
MRFWLLAVVLTVAPCFADVDTSADSPKELAMALARKAKKAAKSGESAQAYIYYSEAAALQPGNRKYKANMVLLQTRAATQSKPVLRASAGPSQVDLSPEDVFDSLTAQELSQARELKELPSLRAKPGEQNFDLNGDSRSLFDNVAQAFGLEPVYDGDYPKGGPTIRFQITGADYREALHDLEAATGSFVIPLSNRVFMVAQDTPAKRNDLEQTMAIAVPASGLTTQQLTEMGQVIRQTTNVEKIAWDSTQSRLVLRDRASRVLPAVALVQQLATYHPEVMIDLEFIQVAASDMINYGFTVTNSVSGIMLGNIFHNIVSTPSGITNLLTFGGGKTLIG